MANGSVNKILGDITAENDKVLFETFIETPDYKSLIEGGGRLIVVGRRGTGKSAIFKKLEYHFRNDRLAEPIMISPEDSDVIGLRSVINKFDDFNKTRAATKALWKYVILLESLSRLHKNYKTKALIESNSEMGAAVKEWNSYEGSPFAKIRKKYKTLHDPSIDIEEEIGDLQYKLKLQNIQTELQQILKQSKRNIHILIDRLDEGFEADEVGMGMIAGIAYAALEISKKMESVQPILFLRDNVFRSLGRIDPDYSRNLEGEALRLHWDEYLLLNLAAARLKNAFKLQAENSVRVWDRCTANELKGKEGFRKCLQFTLYRPRDLLLLLNQAFSNAKREDRDCIIPSDIEASAKHISISRHQDLIKEYSRAIPSVEKITKSFIGKKSEYTYSEIIDILICTTSNSESDSIHIQQDVAILGPEGMARALYGIGFIGIYDSQTESFVFCHDGSNPNKEFAHSNRVLIHPCYWMALNLNRNILNPSEAEFINDEYGVSISLENEEVRNSRIGGLIAELGSIPSGKSGQSSFEDWSLRAIRTIFAGHLSNIEAHPNGAGLQRRDIVGTNAATVSSWIRINKDYHVRQVNFEVKNYADIGPDEFRQILSYSTMPHGKLAFIITRDEEENLRKGGELDWVREMWFQHRLLVVKLTGKTLSKWLSKIRKPEKHDVIDKLMNSLLDKYERSYLQMTVTPTRKTR